VPPGASTYEPLVVPRFGGGLNLADHPAYIRDDQWTVCEGWLPIDGLAESLPGFTQIGSPIAPNAASQIIGMLPSSFNDRHVLVGVANADGAGAGKLYRVDTTTDIATEITSSGGTPRAESTDVFSDAFLNGYQVLALGGAIGMGANTSSLIRYRGVGTFDLIVPASGERLGAVHIASLGGHVIGNILRVAGEGPETERRRIAWSDANNESIWAPALSNSADDVVLDDASSYIVGVGLLDANRLGVFTRDGVHAFTPTTGIPSFTRGRSIAHVGPGFLAAPDTSAQAAFALIGLTPFGPCFVAADNAYLLTPSLQGIAGPVLDHLLGDEFAGATSFQPQSLLRPIVWHKRLRCIVVPKVSTIDDVLMFFNPVGGGWGRVELTGLGVPTKLLRIGVVYDRFGTTASGGAWNLWVASSQRLYRMNLTTPNDVATVETKDFSTGGQLMYLDRIMVDWEPLVNKTSDELQVSVASRNDLARSTRGGNVDRSIVPFTTEYSTSQTLVAGASEVKVRRTGRYHRVRFRTPSNSRARIRGFKLFWEPAGDRAPADPVT
jgi:hypothetical protein